jgi:PAS domain S-box-containing protein
MTTLDHPVTPQVEGDALFRGLVEQSLSGIYLIQDGRFSYVNPTFARLFGYSVEEILALPSFAALVADEDKALVGENLRRRTDGEIRDIRYSFRCIRKDGTAFEVEIHGARTVMNGRPAVIGTLIDITARRESQLALSESEARFRAMFESSPVGIAVLTLGATFVSANRALETMLGYTSAELSGRPVWELYPDQSSAAPLAYVDRLLSGELESYHREQRFRRRDGREIHVQVTAALIRDDAGQALYGICMMEDVTERKQLEAQLQQAQKMEAVGRFAGGIAHDFNNTLAAIAAYAQILHDDLDADDPRRADAEEILKAASRAGGLTRQILTFSRKKVVERELLDLRQVVGDFETLLRPLLPSPIRLETRLTTEPAVILADRTQIDQVLMNLALNARDAMPSGGTLRIELDVHEAPPQHAPGFLANVSRAPAHAREVSLVVSDTGIGMGDEVRARLFEPFFTTKSDGHGTGLGLATVYAIARQAGGTVNVESQPGAGSRFVVSLPIAAESCDRCAGSGTTPGGRAGDRRDAAAAGDASQGTTVLLAEDEDNVRDAARRLLERAGFNVVTACNATEALQVLDTLRDAVDVLVTDVLMRGMDGVELAARSRTLVPSLRVIVMSGYADALYQNAPGVADVLLEKPFTAATLVGAVRSLASTSVAGATR